MVAHNYTLIFYFFFLVANHTEMATTVITTAEPMDTKRIHHRLLLDVDTELLLGSAKHGGNSA
jgi:hypothetical protein